jgi:hypothetical protein
VKLFSSPITAHRKRLGRGIGSVMRQNRAQAGAPSMRAASYRCCGMACGPVSSTIM